MYFIIIIKKYRHLEFNEIFHSFQASPFVRQVEWFKNVRKWRVKTRDSKYRRLEMQKTLLLQRDINIMRMSDLHKYLISDLQIKCDMCRY